MKTSRKILVLNPEVSMAEKIRTQRKETMEVAVATDFQFVLEHDKAPQLYFQGKSNFEYSFVFIRRFMDLKKINGPLYRLFDSLGIPSEVDIRCHHHTNKISQLIQANHAGIRIPKSVFVAYTLIPEYLDFIETHLQYPMIMKRITTDRGEGNYRVTSREDLLQTYKSAPEDEYIFQECIPNSFDYRFLVLDHKTRIIYKRIRPDDSSHLNNVAAGATTELVPLGSQPELEKLAEQITCILSRTICGVDLMPGHDGEIYFLEGNHSPGVKSFNAMDVLLDFIEEKANS